MAEPVRVLLVDDEEDAYVITRDLLERIKWRKFSLTWKKTYEAGLEAVLKHEHDVCLLDYKLGEHTGIELLKEAIGKDCKSPIILLTARSDREFDLEAMEAGAADYLVKGEITPPLLERSIRYAMERARVLSALRELNETLEERVRERTAELEKSHEELRLAQAQFYQAQKMESLGMLAGGLAHDFGNFVNAAALHADLAFSRIDSASPAKENLTQIRSACHRAGELVREVLLFSRGQGADSALLDLNEMVGGFTKILLGVIGEKFSLEAKLEPGLPLIQAHAGQVQQILMNLVINARDAMPHGGKILLSTGCVVLSESDANLFGASREGRFARLSVKDEGIGMDSETVKKIFDPFFTTKGAKGTGLGLSVVYGIVKEHQGWVEVESEPEKGSTFKVYFPAHGS